MSVYALRAERLSKSYQLGQASRPETLREALVGMAAAPLRRFQTLRGSNPTQGLFKALDDVSFDVAPGEVVGIVGRNGAGKSTLLKILSRIVEPTSGRAEMNGRVASLLEVGTGFHPELTGRENIYLNGSILSMKKKEIDAKFDEIVAFAGVDRFLDTPVKRYSSGMYVRLAFAVAAHLEPEILIVDEVLAVGDAEFQRKCLGKMKDVSRDHGRTVIFVSHNMAAVSTLCDRAILLSGGKIRSDGPTSRVVQEYLIPADESHLGSDLKGHPGRPSASTEVFRSVRFVDPDGAPVSIVAPLADVRIEMNMEMGEDLRSPRIGIGFNNARGERVFAIATYLSPGGLDRLRPATTVTAAFRMPPLYPGRYTLDISVSAEQGPFLDQVEGAAWIEVTQDDYLGTAHPYFTEMGNVLVRSEWSRR